MKGRGGGRRRTAEPSNAPIDKRRDSDASFVSSRSSSIGFGRAPVASDHSHRSSVIRSINNYLSQKNFHIVLRPQSLPSSKDIFETLKFLLSSIGYPCDDNKWSDDISTILKLLNCPIKLSKSSLKTPNTPHNWPTVLALIHWLVQLALYNEHLDSASIFDGNAINSYVAESYQHYIKAEDEQERESEEKFLAELKRQSDSVAEEVGASAKSAADLEARLEQLKNEPSRRELLEKNKEVLEGDVQKFHTAIDTYTTAIARVKEALGEKENGLRVKQEEKKRICEENEELKKRVELQAFKARDVERIKRESQTVERDILEAEAARDSREQKSLELETEIKNLFKELQKLASDGNEAFESLNLDIRYSLNENGLTPSEVMGIDYKSIVKPALQSLSNGMKESSRKRLEELTSLQHQSSEMVSRIETKKSQILSLQSFIDEMEKKETSLKREIQEYIARCDAEAKAMTEGVQIDALNLENLEKEIAEKFKASQARLEEVTKETEEEVNACSREFLALIDSTLRHEEYMESKIGEIKTAVDKTAASVSDIYKRWQNI